MGKHKYIETPEKMWELFEAYKKEVKDNPRVKHVFVGKDGNSDYERLERPLTMEGFKCHVWDVEGFTVEQYFTNPEGAYDEYIGICTRIRETIRRDQIEGGMVGQYNPSITQRLNGLAEKTQNENTQKIEIFKGIDLSVKEDNSAG
jgi:hypothetical protein